MIETKDTYIYNFVITFNESAHQIQSAAVGKKVPETREDLKELEDILEDRAKNNLGVDDLECTILTYRKLGV